MKGVPVRGVLVLLLFAVLLFFFTVVKYPQLYADILYPKVEFWIVAVKDELTDLEGQARWDIVFSGQAYSSFTKSNVAYLNAPKPYKTLHIHEIRYAWEGGAGVFSKDLSFYMPKKIIHDDSRLSGHANEWTESNGRYLWGYSSLAEKKIIPEINFEKIFKGARPGDEFWFTLTMAYGFDDEPVQTQTIPYRVQAIKGTYRPRFFYFFPIP